MKQFPQGIFQTLEWLVKEVEKLKYQISQTSGGNTGVAVDEQTVQGNGIITESPLSSKMLITNVDYDGSNIELAGSKSTFFYIRNPGLSGLSPGTITLPDAVNGVRLMVINMCGQPLTINNLVVSIDNTSSTLTMNNGTYYEFIGYNNNWMFLYYVPV